MPVRQRVRKALPMDALELEVTDADDLGWGGGLLDGQQVRVKGALASEVHRVRLQRREGRAVLAKSLEVLRASPDRVPGGCPHFDVCGGCAWQHVAPAVRLQRQQDDIAGRLAAAGVDAPRPLPPVLGPLLHYRRRARLSARYTQRGGRMFLGFMEAASRHVAEIETCAILVEPLASTLPSLRRSLESLTVRHAIPQVELAAGDDGAIVVLRHLERFTQADLRMLRNWEAETGVHVWSQSGGPATAEPLQPDAPRFLHYQVAEGAPRMAFHPLDFVQINAAINTELVALAREALRECGAERVLDLFCGIGNFTLPIARDVREVVGVESVQELVQRARANAQTDLACGVHVESSLDDDSVAAAGEGIGHPAAGGRRGAGHPPRFVISDLHGAASERLLELGTFDAIVLDQPRTGLGASLAVVPKLGARRLIYVSCNPVSFATDVQALAAAGYRLQSWRVLDMFPHTRHVECMGVLDLQPFRATGGAMRDARASTNDAS